MFRYTILHLDQCPQPVKGGGAMSTYETVSLLLNVIGIMLQLASIRKR